MATRRECAPRVGALRANVPLPCDQNRDRARAYIGHHQVRSTVRFRSPIATENGLLPCRSQSSRQTCRRRCRAAPNRAAVPVRHREVGLPIFIEICDRYGTDHPQWVVALRAERAVTLPISTETCSSLRWPRPGRSPVPVQMPDRHEREGGPRVVALCAERAVAVASSTETVPSRAATNRIREGVRHGKVAIPSPFRSRSQPTREPYPLRSRASLRTCRAVSEQH